jgi:hypothetical protein
MTAQGSGWPGSSKHARWQRSGRRLAFALPVIVFFAAATRFIFARPVSETRFPALVPEPDGRHDLALFQYGPVLRASSVGWAGRHHPGYAVDGRQSGSSGEAWVPDDRDRLPWIEVAFQRPREIDELVVIQAGSPRRFDVECYAASRQTLRLSLDANEPRVSTTLSCRGTDRVRLTFHAPEAGGVLAVAELELWGL